MKQIIISIILFLIAGCKSENVRVPEDFNFFFSYGTSRINTSDSTFSRMLEGGARDTIVKLVISEKAKKRIFQALIKNDFETLPKLIADTGCIIPSIEEGLAIKYNGVRRVVRYSLNCETKDKKLTKRYYSIREKIMDVIANNKEIESLPETKQILL